MIVGRLEHYGHVEPFLAAWNGACSRPESGLTSRQSVLSVMIPHVHSSEPIANSYVIRISVRL